MHALSNKSGFGSSADVLPVHHWFQVGTLTWAFKPRSYTGPFTHGQGFLPSDCCSIANTCTCMLVLVLYSTCGFLGGRNALSLRRLICSRHIFVFLHVYMGQTFHSSTRSCHFTVHHSTLDFDMDFVSHSLRIFSSSLEWYTTFKFGFGPSTPAADC
jgi:hypothetical protein